MALTPYLEDLRSQIPAIQVLCALGGHGLTGEEAPRWQYLSREEALHLRGGRTGQVVLSGILKPWLAAHNRIETRGETHEFTEANLTEAVRRLTDEPFDGLVRTNEKIYHLLTLGTSLDQTIHGERKGRQLHYIDWKHPENNVYHVTDEFMVEKARSHDTRRPDIVLFVNGIPFVVIECKRSDKDRAGEKQVDAAIRQLRQYQKNDEIPHLFQYAQLLLATSVNKIRYGTVGTPRQFWSLWKEEGAHKQAVHAAANQRLAPDVEARLFAPLDDRHADGYREARNHFDDLWAAGDRLPTVQDATLWAMLRPERLLDFVYGFVVFDAGMRKVARYQQFFAVKATLEKVTAVREGRRTGGVIWHTTGSGKSLTMVMLAKALALHPAIPNPRVVLVTDRVDLDAQLWRTFEACGKAPERARTGEHLLKLIREGKAGVITTVVNKFETVQKKHGIKDDNPNVFVLVDEGHRTQYGSVHAKMRQVFPNACYIGFTGTPLLRKDKNTARKFGGFIHGYSMGQAVADGAVSPLHYEGRVAFLEQDQEAIDRWFERVTEGLTDKQKADLKRTMGRKEEVQKATKRLKEIAYDIARHYRMNFAGTGLKAQLAADSRTSAILYRRYLTEFGFPNCEVIMSSPDTRYDEEAEASDDRPTVQAFWKEMMERFGSEEAYNKEILASFHRPDGTEILIVVDKLLTGFDEPRNTVLYVDKPLKEHNILQAIARVNRLFEGKQTGYVIDYRGILGQLNEAMQTYEALGGFDPEDVDLGGAVIDTHEEVAKLPQRHTDLWDVFKEVQNRKDVEALEQHLAAEDVRQAFYDALRAYQNTLATALATDHFYADTPPERIQAYKDDLKFFRGLRGSVQQRYSDTVDYGQYETQIRRVMDTHIHAKEAKPVTDLVNIFDTEKFDAEIERVQGKAAKADRIASRVKKTVHEKMEEDPVFYRKFSVLVQQAIDDYRRHRIDEAEFLRRVEGYLDTIRQGYEAGADLPDEVKRSPAAKAYFGVLGEVLARYKLPGGPSALAAEMAVRIEEIIETHRRVGWQTSQDAVKRMANDIDDYLFDQQDRTGVRLSTADMDEILERCLAIARKLAGA